MSNRNGNNGKEDNWIDFTGDLFSVNTTDWGTVQESICGDASSVEVDDRHRIVVDAENQYGQLYNSTQLHNTLQNQSGATPPNVSSNENGSYLPGGYANNYCDESDYGEILINEHECDAVSTVTPATFAQREPRLMDFSHYNESTTLAACNQTTMATGADESPIEVSYDDTKSKKRRKFLIGGILLVSAMLVAVVIAVPVVVTKKSSGTQVASAEKGNAGAQKENQMGIESDDGGLDSYGLKFNSTSEEDTSYEQNEPGLDVPIDINEEVDLSSDNSSTPPKPDQESEFLEDSNYSEPASTAENNDEPSDTTDNPSSPATDLDDTQYYDAVTQPAIEGDNAVPIPENSPTSSAGGSPDLSVTVSDEAPQPAIESPTAPISSPSESNSASTPTTSTFDTAPPFLATTPAPISALTNSNNAGIPTGIFSSDEGTLIPTDSFANQNDYEEFDSTTPTPTFVSVPDNTEEQLVPSTPFASDSPTSSPHPPTLEPTKFTESVVKISLQTDKQGYETSWTLEAIEYNMASNSNSSTVIASVDENTYSSYQKDSKTLTLPRGAYRFTLRDSFGDGFCCKDFEGYYKIAIDGVEVIKGGYFRSEISYVFLIGHFPEMTDREKQWLEAHNVRRKQWHEGNGVSYVPLKWSAELTKHAQLWANKLTDKCEVVGIDHEHDVEEGENLAKNQADGRKGMGQLYPPDNIVRRWVDFEADLPNPQNLHLTQALWRATKYVGCADALREGEDGYVCRIQVCRYAKAGNCQMGKYNVTDGDNWLIPMLMDDTPCPPECPPEGCF